MLRLFDRKKAYFLSRETYLAQIALNRPTSKDEKHIIRCLLQVIVRVATLKQTLYQPRIGDSLLKKIAIF